MVCVLGNKRSLVAATAKAFDDDRAFLLLHGVIADIISIDETLRRCSKVKVAILILTDAILSRNLFSTLASAAAQQHDDHRVNHF